MTPGKFNRLLKKRGAVLAKATDKDGYTITCTKGADEQMSGSTRRGTLWITDPQGETVQAGYWMDLPEPDMDPQQYEAMPEADRAALECQHQIKRYAGLPHDFEHYRFGSWTVPNVRQRLQARIREVSAAHPEMAPSRLITKYFRWASFIVPSRQMAQWADEAAVFLP